MKTANKIYGIGSLVALIIISFFSWKPLLSPGFFPIHDNQQIARLFELDKALAAGQFPVRWVGDLGFGFGYPLFNFYPPLIYYLGEIFHLLGAGYIDSIKLVWFTALVGSSLAMYFLAKKIFGRIGAVVAAVFYLYAPYHAVDAYIRGSLAELFSFVWLPLILLFSYKSIVEKNKFSVILTGLFLALLMITHNLIFLPFFGLFTFWYASLTLIYNRHALALSASRYLLAAILDFGLTAFFWLPSLVEKQYTLVDQLLIKNLASYQIHFVCPQQLWNSPWGFGGSTAGCLDGLSFKIGKLHILLSIVTLAVALYLWIKNNRKIAMTLFTAFVLLVISAYMTTDYSKFVWDNLSVLWYLQFPWRFLEFVALFISLLSASIFIIIKQPVIKLFLAVLMIGLLLFYEAKYFTPQKFFPLATDASETSDEQIKWVVSSTSFEYMPKGFATKITNLGTLWVDIDQSKIPVNKYRILSGDFKISQENFFPDHFLINGTSSSKAIIEFNTTNFPGWKLWLDGQEKMINDNNSYKLVTITLLPGKHTITGRFTNTPVRNLGNSISIVFIIGVVAYEIRNGTRRSS